jgi:hypothetical protein
VSWPFAALTAGLALALALVLLPGSLRARSPVAGMAATPSGRLGLAGGLGVAAGGGALFLLPEWPLAPGGFSGRVFADLGTWGWRLGALGPPAAVGAAGLWLRPSPDRRRALLLLLVWAGTAAVAVLVVTGVPQAAAVVPAHRVVLFALGVPLLAAAGVVWVAGLVPGRLGAAGVGVAVVVVAGAVAGSTMLARGAVRPDRPGRARQFAEARAAGTYLAGVPTDRAAVFTFADPGFRFYRSVVRMALPREWISRAFGYLGSPQRLLEGRPSSKPGDPAYEAVSGEYWEAIRPELAVDPIVLVLDSLNPRSAARGGYPVAPGVTVVAGPEPSSPALGPVPRVPSGWAMAADLSVALSVLAATGLGWSAALVPAGWIARASLAPAIGIALLVVVGVAGDRLGADGPLARAVLLGLVTVTGWALGGARLVTERRRPG